MPPSEVSTHETVKFLERRLKLSNLRLLEVGCGQGELGYALTRKKVAYQGIDISEEAYFAARKRRINVQCADILEFRDEQPYDVVLFTYSLHHIQPLENAIGAAVSLLKPNGLLILEEFAVEDADENTLSWLYHINELLKITGVMNDHLRHQSVAKSTEAWNYHHAVKHNVARADAMLAAIRSQFSKVEIQQCEFLYRYCLDNLRPTDVGERIGRNVLEWERELIRSGAIKSLGLRVVASQQSETTPTVSMPVVKTKKRREPK